MTVYPTYNPTPVIAGDFPLRARLITVAAGQNATGAVLPKGTLLGQKSADGIGAAVKASGPNTGTGTMTLDAVAPILANVLAGTYTVRLTSPTAFRVSDPKGDVLGDGVAGAAFADQIKFVVAAGGTAFVVGDGFDIAVIGSGKYVLSKTSATDGSQVPVCMTTDDVDASVADVSTRGYVTGDFAFEIANIDPSWTITALNQAFQARAQSMFFHSVGLAA